MLLLIEDITSGVSLREFDRTAKPNKMPRSQANDGTTGLIKAQLAWRQREYVGCDNQETVRTWCARFIWLHAESGFSVWESSAIFVVVPKAFRLTSQGESSSVLSRNRTSYES